MAIAIEMTWATRLATFITKTFPLDSTSVLSSAYVFTACSILFSGKVKRSSLESILEPGKYKACTGGTHIFFQL